MKDLSYKRGHRTNYRFIKTPPEIKREKYQWTVREKVEIRLCCDDQDLSSGNRKWNGVFFLKGYRTSHAAQSVHNGQWKVGMGEKLSVERETSTHRLPPCMAAVSRPRQLSSARSRGKWWWRDVWCGWCEPSWQRTEPASALLSIQKARAINNQRKIKCFLLFKWHSSAYFCRLPICQARHLR